MPFMHTPRDILNIHFNANEGVVNAKLYAMARRNHRKRYAASLRQPVTFVSYNDTYPDDIDWSVAFYVRAVNRNPDTIERRPGHKDCFQADLLHRYGWEPNPTENILHTVDEAHRRVNPYHPFWTSVEQLTEHLRDQYRLRIDKLMAVTLDDDIPF